MSFAEGTTVPVEKSKAEIEGLLRKYGADQFVAGSDWTTGREFVHFRCAGRFLRFELALPVKTERRFTHVKHKGRYFETQRTEAQVLIAWDAEVRRIWRALALVIKAKLEAVQSGISTFDHEFLAHIVMPDGKTIGQHVVPQIEAAYTTGKMQPLLPPPPEER